MIIVYLPNLLHEQATIVARNLFSYEEKSTIYLWYLLFLGKRSATSATTYPSS